MFCLRAFAFCVDLAPPLWLFVSPPSLPRAWQQETVDAFRAHVADNIVHGRGDLKRMAAALPVDVPNRKRICRRGR